MKVEQYLCEFDGKVLRGKEGTAEIKKRYLSIQGTVTIQFWDGGVNRPSFFYVSPQRNCLMTFCDLTCFQKYIEMREKEEKEKSNRNNYREYQNNNENSY